MLIIIGFSYKDKIHLRYCIENIYRLDLSTDVLDNFTL